MYIQENLTTTPYELPGISWEVPAALEGRLRQYGAFAKLVLDEGKTALLDIAEDSEARAAFEALRAKEQAEQAARARAAALEAQGVRAMARTMFRAQAASMPADEVIRCRALAGEWSPGTYQAGDVRALGGVPYRCCQAHDSTGNPDWKPGAASALWAAYHGTSPETALPWEAPSGAHDLYKSGECMVWTDGQIMRAVQDTAFSPGQAPDAWEVAAV